MRSLPRLLLPACAAFTVGACAADVEAAHYPEMPMTCAQATTATRAALSAFAGALDDPARLLTELPRRISDSDPADFLNYEPRLCEIRYRAADPEAVLPGAPVERSVLVSFERYQTAAERGTRSADPVGDARDRLARTEEAQLESRHFADLGDGGFAFDSFDRSGSSVLFRRSNILVLIGPRGVDAPAAALDLAAQRAAAEAIARAVAAALPGR
ncbi:hypothetical protein [Nocardia sp. NPDC048505]|uniref:hypothetical protein n=1 Tax=unclassified Nocardia TaxID=2637762 RepID=UPI0033FD0B6B